MDDDFKGVILYLANVLTGQKEEIIINYNNSGTGMGPSLSVNSITDFIFVLILTCLLLFIAYFLIFSEIFWKSEPSPIPRTVPIYTILYIGGGEES